jgi:methylmalonyl-CoA/ethylmalonyl-CoA epimerase
MDLDHVALASRDIGDALDVLVGQLGGLVVFGGNNVGFRAMQVHLGDGQRGLNVELMEPWSPETNDFLERFVARHGASAHHLTFKVDDLAARLPAVEAAGFHPVNVDLSDPNWKEAFLHPKEAQGTVVQLAESHGFFSRDELVRHVLAGGPEGHPAWWPAPPPRPENEPELRRVVMRTPSLPDALHLFADVLEGRRVDAGEGWVELAWPGHGHLALEHRPGTDPGIDRVEVEVGAGGSGALGEHLLCGTRFVVTPRR